jgi:hypothetical protein
LLLHLVTAAFLAISALLSVVNELALALPPTKPPLLLSAAAAFISSSSVFSIVLSPVSLSTIDFALLFISDGNLLYFLCPQN